MKHKYLFRRFGGGLVFLGEGITEAKAFENAVELFAVMYPDEEVPEESEVTGHVLSLFEDYVISQLHFMDFRAAGPVYYPSKGDGT